MKHIQIPECSTELNQFLTNEHDKVLAYIKKTYSLGEEDGQDIFQEASIALYMNIRGGKLTTLTSSLSTYFLRICINQSLKYLSKRQRTIPLVDERTLLNGKDYDISKAEELFEWCTSDENADFRAESERIVDKILDNLPDTCRNIFTGYYWQNLSANVIANMFGFANANSVKSQKYKCVDRFKKKYNEMMRLLS